MEQPLDNYDAQRQFAEHSLEWRIESAKRAGIHPLAALGANLPQYSPTYSGGGGGGGIVGGQSYGRATGAAMSQTQRDELTTQQIELGNIMIDTRREELNQLKNPAIPRSAGVGGLQGQGQYPMSARPEERTYSGINTPERSHGAIADYGFARTRTGLTIVPGKDIKERIEDQLIPEAAWALRNQLMPFFRSPRKPSTKEFPLPPGFEWVWYKRYMEFRPYRTGGRMPGKKIK